MISIIELCLVDKLCVIHNSLIFHEMDVQIMYFLQNSRTLQILPPEYPVHEMSGFTMWMLHKHFNYYLKRP